MLLRRQDIDSLTHSPRYQQFLGPSELKSRVFNMHGLSILALAIGATAAAVESCAPYCQFPKSITCPANGKTLTRDEIVAAAVNGNRSGPPYEESAANIATTHCSDTKFKGVPLYAVSFSRSYPSMRESSLSPNIRMLTLMFAGQSSKFIW